MALTPSTTFAKTSQQQQILAHLRVSPQDVDDIMCSALEGGISYWCSEAEVNGNYLGTYAHEQISRGGTLRLHDAEEDEQYELTMEKFLNGLNLFLENRPDLVSDHGCIDAGDFDGVCADSIVQLALFGELIFG